MYGGNIIMKVSIFNIVKGFSISFRQIFIKFLKSTRMTEPKISVIEFIVVSLVTNFNMIPRI